MNFNRDQKQTCYQIFEEMFDASLQPIQQFVKHVPDAQLLMLLIALQPGPCMGYLYEKY